MRFGVLLVRCPKRTRGGDRLRPIPKNLNRFLREPLGRRNRRLRPRGSPNRSMRLGVFALAYMAYVESSANGDNKPHRGEKRSFSTLFFNQLQINYCFELFVVLGVLKPKYEVWGSRLRLCLNMSALFIYSSINTLITFLFPFRFLNSGVLTKTGTLPFVL